MSGRVILNPGKGRINELLRADDILVGEDHHCTQDN